MTSTAPVDADPTARLQHYWELGQAQRDARARLRAAPPLTRLWDGDWNLRGRVAGELAMEWEFVLNDSGSASLTLPIDHHLAVWLLRRRRAGTAKNTHLTIDKDGTRWSGRLTKLRSKTTEDGKVVVAEFLHDYEELKHLRIWSNPVLPAAIQFPRLFMLLGPSIWALKTTLFLNLMRNQNSLFTLPDDPLDFSQWTGNLDMRNWAVTVRGGGFLEDGSPHALVSSRFKTFHELAAPILADGELMVTCQRWLLGDPEPWPGYTPRNGQLIIDIVDRSGWWGSTGTGGNVLTGILRTVAQLADDLVEMDRHVVADPARTPVRGDWLGTAPGAPWVVYRDGVLSGVTDSEWTWEPATDVQMIVGGHSMPGVNELLSAAVQLAGDLASSMFLGANINLGQLADTLLKPLYTDTVLAWVAFKSFTRAQELGWSHYFEHMPSSNSDRGYTLSSLMAIRRAFWETRERVGDTFSVADGAPYLIGAAGRGHFFVGDRIARTLPGDSDGELVVDRVTKAHYTLQPDNRGWTVTVGSSAADESGMQRVLRHISSTAAAAHDLGVL